MICFDKRPSKQKASLLKGSSKTKDMIHIFTVTIWNIETKEK